MPSRSTISSYQRGRWAEQIVLEYLLEHRLKLLERNFRTAFGEVDLIMREGEIIVFVEVRYRANNRFHTALESVDRQKCERIICTSQQYFNRYRSGTRSDGRFDVVTLSGARESLVIDWIKNAFELQ